MAQASGVDRVLMKGNEAVSEGAIAGGCRFFFAYPITPQNQIPEYMARHLPEVGGLFLQAESEIGAIQMAFGASAAGARVMTSSSGPGISLKQEGLSYLIGARLPVVVCDIARGGPGLGNIGPSQQDYYLATRVAGHGGGHCLVLAPASVQELYDMAYEAFDLADEYRNPVMILGDALLGQMMEPLTPKERRTDLGPAKDWAVGGPRHGRPARLANSLYAFEPDLEANCRAIQEAYDRAAAEITRWEEYGHDEPEVALVAYGTSARVSQTVADWANDEGLRVRLLRPQTLFPFPYAALKALGQRVRGVLVVEMSMGQLVDDVRLAVEGACPVRHFGRTGGVLHSPEEVLQELKGFVAGL